MPRQAATEQCGIRSWCKIMLVPIRRMDHTYSRSLGAMDIEYASRWARAVDGRQSSARRTTTVLRFHGHFAWDYLGSRH